MPDTLDATISVVRRELEQARAPKCFPEIFGETSFEHDLRCCAIDMTCISHEIEDAFGVELPAEAFEQCETVGQVAELVQSLITENAQ